MISLIVKKYPVKIGVSSTPSNVTPINTAKKEDPPTQLKDTPVLLLRSPTLLPVGTRVKILSCSLHKGQTGVIKDVLANNHTFPYRVIIDGDHPNSHVMYGKFEVEQLAPI